MISLTAELPRHLTIGGENYAINTDFRIMLEFESRISVANVSDRAAFSRIVAETVSALFLSLPPQAHVDEVIEKMLWYYRCGKEPAAKSEKTSESSRKRYYDFSEDSDYIYAAFRQQYGVDLSCTPLHWWEFRALFCGLTEETEMVKIMQYRGTDLKKIKNKAEKSRIKKLQERFALKEQKIERFSSLESRDEAIKRRALERYREAQKKLEEAKINGK